MLVIVKKKEQHWQNGMLNLNELKPRAGVILKVYPGPNKTSSISFPKNVYLFLVASTLYQYPKSEKYKPNHNFTFFQQYGYRYLTSLLGETYFVLR